MNNVFNYIFKIQSDAAKVTAGMDKLNASVTKVEHSTVVMDKGFQRAFNQINKSIETIKLSSVLDQVDRVANGLNTLNKPGMDLSTSMYDLSAMTGVAGDKLKEIEGYARKSATTFGGSAAAGAESYKLILGQLTPEIAKVPAALDSMGKSSATTSKLMGGDQVAATELLTTAMNQYQVSLDDPIKASAEMARMMNVMAAAAGEGSAELPQIKQALEQAGMGAKMANVNFAETNAAIQILDKAGKKGSEGGVALRNVLVKLGQGKYIPPEYQKQLKLLGVDTAALADKNTSLSQRLTALKPAMKDSALLSAWLGEGADGATKALMAQIPELEELTKKITGTNTAYQQAAIVMESPLEKNKRLQAQIDDFKISLFNGTNGLIGYASVIGETARDVSNLVPMFTLAGDAISFLTSKQKLLDFWTKVCSVSTGIWSGVQAVFNAVMAMNPIVLIVIGIMALIAAIAWVVNSTEGWGEAWKHTVNGAKLLFQAYVESVKFYFSTMVNGIMIGINYIQEGWYKFKEAMGMGDSSENLKMISQIHADTEARKKAIVDGAQKVKVLGMAAKNEFVLAGQSVKWKKGAEKVEQEISAPRVPGTVPTDAAGGAGGSDDKKSKTNEAIATGGTKHNYITITLDKLIEAVYIQGKDFKDSAQQLEEKTQDAMMRVLALATTAGS